MTIGIPEIPTPDEYIDRVFGDSGLLASRFPGYAKRDGQIALARAIDSAIGVGEHVFAEAGTGVGKSIAYLVPATYHAARTNKHVVVVTANISLTEQIVKKDLPMLASILPWKFTYGLLKGKSNYLCASKLIELNTKRRVRDPNYTRNRGQFDEILQWGEDSFQNDGLGDVSELSFQPMAEVWGEASVSANDCRGSRCKEYRQCFAVKAQRRARESKIIVTNYHMLFLHLMLRAASDVETILPAFDTLILDEAHKAGDIARDCFGTQIGYGAFKRIVNTLGRTTSSGSLLARTSDYFFERVGEYRIHGNYKSRLKESLISNTEFDIREAWRELYSAMDNAKDDLSRRINSIYYKQNTSDATSVGSDVLASISGMPAMESQVPTGVYSKEAQEMEGAHDRLSEIQRDLSQAVRLDQGLDDDDEASEIPDKFVYFIDAEPNSQRIYISKKPVDVSSILDPLLFSKTRVVVCTSATLAINQKFTYAMGEMGCDDATTLIAESPFDFRKNALLIIPKMPSPKEPEFQEEMVIAIRKIIDAAGGKTLVLFTSRKSMLKAYNHPLIQQSGHYVLCQDSMPPNRLAERFRSDTKSVLFGLERFWAGLDVPGESLSVVIIEKIPFPTPNDPVLDVLSERAGMGAFAKYFIPKAVIMMKQGFGRLIRSATDRGVVVILDTRLLDMPYGKNFLRSLPETRISRDLDDVKEFLDLYTPMEKSNEEK